MDKIKAFYDKNKKIVIPVAIVLVLLIAVGIYFVSQPNSDTNKKIETQTEEKADTSKDDKKEEDKNKDSEDKKADKKDTADKPADNGNASANASAQNDNAPASKPSNNGNGNSNGNSNQSASKPAHSHSWKNHTATKQVWVSKIVPVYETQTVQVGTEKVSQGWYYHCSGCGAEIQGASSNPAAREHIMAHIKAGEASNGYNVEKFTEKPIYETKQVQVGTKDEGHYETQSYTDYQYCDCGATR